MPKFPHIITTTLSQLLVLRCMDPHVMFHTNEYAAGPVDYNTKVEGPNGSLLAQRTIGDQWVDRIAYVPDDKAQQSGPSHGLRTFSAAEDAKLRQARRRYEAELAALAAGAAGPPTPVHLFDVRLEATSTMKGGHDSAFVVNVANNTYKDTEAFR